ncbi:hypothetical protein ACFOQM_00470 [Paenibacillus sp. GCM10012307]|uniref:Uncharacterized protein n=1 Tax=Paenibacillus roseus TaxID=2798579 RepID=A0A934MT79_9BACL|nr:hypothetical protein [Paenibacillus roseus]MBJ6359802.1 hypothetical protein [Paenibacillus roseus]
MDHIVHKSFTDEEIHFENLHFIGCTFIRCRIFVTSLKFDYDRCSFTDCIFHIDPEVPYSHLLRPLLPYTSTGIA